MDEHQSRGDRERAEQHLREFFKAMNQWEGDSYARHLKDTGRALPAELAATARVRAGEELERVYAAIQNRFCVRKPRVSGAAFRFPPTFDKPERMEVAEVREPAADRIELLTAEWNGRRWRFVLQKVGPAWLLASAQWYDALRQQWSAHLL
jgi:hypothetical protein